MQLVFFRLTAAVEGGVQRPVSGGEPLRAAGASDIKAVVKDYARELGFDLVRVTDAAEFAQDRDIALARIEEGLMEGLPWYTAGRVMRGSSPEELLPGARSIICLGMNYYPEETAGPEVEARRVETGLTGKIARYARGRDYHRVMKGRMRDYAAGLAGGGWVLMWRRGGMWMMGRCWIGRRRRGPGWGGSARTATF